MFSIGYYFLYKFYLFSYSDWSLTGTLNNDLPKRIVSLYPVLYFYEFHRDMHSLLSRDSCILVSTRATFIRVFFSNLFILFFFFFFHAKGWPIYKTSIVLFSGWPWERLIMRVNDFIAFETGLQARGSASKRGRNYRSSRQRRSTDPGRDKSS